MEQYVNALIKEIQYSRHKMAEYLIDTVFIGGGTPSILDENLIEKILHTLRANCNISPDAEMTIECNPGTVTREKLCAYKAAGIGRLSFGLQSADDIELRSIGRIHTYEQFLESYRMARECGVDNINIDLMSALPGQTVASYRTTLEKVIALNPEHISAYSLIVEEETKMYQRVAKAEEKGIRILPEEEEEREMYYLTKEVLGSAGYKRYEISNYAKKGSACRHNIGYWKRREYLGFGIGAASLYQGMRYSNVRDIQTYMKCLLQKGNGNARVLHQIEENREILSPGDAMSEFMFLGLRMMVGISVYAFEKQFGIAYREIFGEISNRLIKEGLLEQQGENIRLTERGVDVSNYVMAEFLL